MVDTVNSSTIIIDVINSEILRDTLQDNLMALQFVDDISADFPDSDTYEDLIMGDVSVDDYVEGEAIKIGDVDFGSRSFTINQYKSTGVKVTEKVKQDSRYASQVLSKLPIKQAYAIGSAVESDIMKQLNDIQTAASTNAKAGYKTRFIAGSNGGTGDELGTVLAADLAYAATYLNALKYTGRKVGLLPLYQSFLIMTQAALTTSLQYNPRVEGFITQDLLTGMNAININLFGIDLLVSNYTAVIDAEENEVRDTSTKYDVTDGGVASIFADMPDRRPVRFAWRQQPAFINVEKPEMQTTFIYGICRYGVGSGETENLVNILCSKDAATTIAAA